MRYLVLACVLGSCAPATKGPSDDQPMVAVDGVTDGVLHDSAVLPMLRATSSDSLLCIGRGVDGVVLLGWLATNGYLDHPAFQKLFRPERADEYVVLTHGSGHSIELNYYGIGWHTTGGYDEPTDRLIATSFFAMEPRDRLLAVMLARAVLPVDVEITEADSLTFRAMARRIAEKMVTAWPDSCGCPSIAFEEWSPALQDSLLDEWMWQLVGAP